MNPTAAAPSASALAPTHDPTPVEAAAVDGIAAQYGPETFLWITFPRPGGRFRTWYAWTTGGQNLGDHIDRLALAARLDAADWLHVAGRHQESRTRGRITIWAYALRPVLADVTCGLRSPAEGRDRLRDVLTAIAGAPGPRDRVRWLGFGPELTRRRD